MIREPDLTLGSRMADELWHYVEARRDDGVATLFRIRELAPQPALTRIFVVELPYPTTELSRLPSAASHRRIAELEEQWLRPAAAALGWQLVAACSSSPLAFWFALT